MLSTSSLEQSALQLLEQLPVGLIFCDAEARIEFSNELALAILRRGDGVCARDGRLLGGSAETTRRLRCHIRSAVARAAPRMETMTVGRVSSSSPLLLMIGTVAAVTPPSRPDAPASGLAVVYVADTDLERNVSETLLADLFALTFAEARLLKRLIDGNTLKQASQRNRISEGTARGYLKRIFQKTGTNRQSDLIRLVTNSPAWLLRDAAAPAPVMNA